MQGPNAYLESHLRLRLLRWGILTVKEYENGSMKKNDALTVFLDSMS